MIGRSTLMYGAVSGSCLLLHNAVMILADRAGAPLIASVVLSFLLVALLGYVLHSLLTFREALGREKLGLMRFGRYALAMSTNIPLAFATTWVWHGPVGLPMHWAAPIASGCMLAVNFVLSRWAIVMPGKTARQG